MPEFVQKFAANTVLVIANDFGGIDIFRFILNVLGYFNLKDCLVHLLISLTY